LRNLVGVAFQSDKIPAVFSPKEIPDVIVLVALGKRHCEKAPRVKAGKKIVDAAALGGRPRKALASEQISASKKLPRRFTLAEKLSPELMPKSMQLPLFTISIRAIARRLKSIDATVAAQIAVNLIFVIEHNCHSFLVGDTHHFFPFFEIFCNKTSRAKPFGVRCPISQF